MRLSLKINNVEGQDDQGRHILLIQAKDLSKGLLQEHTGWLLDEIVRPLLKHQPKLLAQVIDDPTLRNVIYMQEKAAREAKAEKRERKRLFEIERQRRADQHKASIATRKALDFYHDVLGIED
jgi:hypothetical protein